MLGDRSPHFLVSGYRCDLSHLRVYRSLVQAFLAPHERENELADGTRYCRHVGHTDSGTT